MIRSIAVAAALALAAPAAAQDGAARIAAAEAFVATEGGQHLLNEVFALRRLMARIQQQNPDMSEPTRLRVAQIAAEELDASAETYRQALVTAAARSLSAEDLERMAALFGTVEAADLLLASRILFANLSQESQAEIDAMNERIRTRVESELGN